MMENKKINKLGNSMQGMFKKKLQKLSFKAKFNHDILTLQETTERYFLYLFGCMFLLKRYSFPETLLKKIGLSDNQLNELPVTKTFLGNVWRIRACCEIYELTRGLNIKQYAIDTTKFDQINDKLF
jgi:hypothetical protein